MQPQPLNPGTGRGVDPLVVQRDHRALLHDDPFRASVERHARLGIDAHPGLGGEPVQLGAAVPQPEDRLRPGVEQEVEEVVGVGVVGDPPGAKDGQPPLARALPELGGLDLGVLQLHQPRLHQGVEEDGVLGLGVPPRGIGQVEPEPSHARVAEKLPRQGDVGPRWGGAHR